jgi:DNA-binding GntR family transcriptional regulator
MDEVAQAQPASMPDIVHAHLRDEVMSGRLGSGEKIRQGEIAKRLGFSRVPVREALRRLESEGFVTLRPRRGYVVVSLDADEIEEIFDIRMVLEEKAGHLATLSRTSEDVADLERILQAMGRLEVHSGNDIAAWSAYNREFHARVFQSSNRLHLCRWAAVLRDSVERYIRIDATMSGRIEAAHVEHEEILKAFRDRDAKRVGQLSRAHCQHTCAALVASLRGPQAKA